MARTQLAELLRREREREALTQDELSDKSGVSRNTIAAIELGRIKIPSPDIIRDLARALRVPVRDFVRAMGYLIDEDRDTLSAQSEGRLLQELEDVLRRHQATPTRDGESGA